jgi:hypothetical protein
MLYFNTRLVEAPDFEGLRLNREEIVGRLDIARLDNYLTLIASPALEARWRSLQKFLAL